MSDEKLRDSSRSSKLEEPVSRVGALQNFDAGATSVCNRQPCVKRRLILRRDIVLLDVSDDELPMEPPGDDLGNFHHFLHVGARSDAYEDPFVRAKTLTDTMALKVLIQLIIYDIGGYHQGQFAQFR